MHDNFQSEMIIVFCTSNRFNLAKCKMTSNWIGKTFAFFRFIYQTLKLISIHCITMIQWDLLKEKKMIENFVVSLDAIINCIRLIRPQVNFYRFCFCVNSQYSILHGIGARLLAKSRWTSFDPVKSKIRLNTKKNNKCALIFHYHFRTKKCFFWCVLHWHDIHRISTASTMNS